MVTNSKEYAEKHRKENRDKYNESQRKYQQTDKCKEARKKTNKTPLRRARNRRYTLKLRQDVLKAYGSRCACCGETEPIFLEVDHIDNDGAEHRRQLGSKKLYLWLKKNDYPDNFQLLCCNCNKGKYLNGGICPHEDSGVNRRH
jgi:hypothetical protein